MGTIMSNFLELFPQYQLGESLIEFALLVNEFALSQPALSLKERDRVNGIFEQIIVNEFSQNVARLPDEAVASYRQAAGSAVHAIGHSLLLGENGPLVPATLARTTLENCALVVFLSTGEDHLRRTGRAINALHDSLRGSGAESPDSPLHPIVLQLKQIKERTGSIGVSKSDSLSQNYEKLVGSQLERISGAELYKILNRYAHHNLYSHISVMISANDKSIDNYVNIYDFSVRAGAALVLAVDASANYKQAINPELIRSRDRVAQYYDNFFNFAMEMQSKFPDNSS